MDKLERRKRFIINFLYFAIIATIILVGSRYILPFLVPFLTGFCIAYILMKPINFLHSRLHMPKALAAVFCVTVFYTAIGLIICAISLWGYSSIESLISEIPNMYNNYLKEAVLDITQYVKDFTVNIENNENLIQIINEASKHIISFLSGFISTISNFAIGSATGIIKWVPVFLLRFLLTIISTFFVAIDYSNIVDFAKKQIGKEVEDFINKVKGYIVGTVFVCIKSYAIIMLISFVELSIGLSILGVGNQFLIAFIIAVLDILPILGTGTVVIPWGIISLITGDIKLGIGLLAMYVIITVIRQIIEPKIVGAQLGLHPLITLISMFIGVNLAGIIGLFGLPILLSLLVYLNNEGVIKIFK